VFLKVERCGVILTNQGDTTILVLSVNLTTLLFMLLSHGTADSGPVFNPLTPNDHHNGRTAPLTSKRSILYIYSTNIGIEYFKHGINFRFFLNAICFIILTYLVPVLFTFYIQDVLKLKKKNSSAKRLIKLTYLLTPRSSALLEKLTRFQLVKKSPAFYGTRRFITAVTSARQLSLSWASSIQSTSPYLLN